MTRFSFYENKKSFQPSQKTQQNTIQSQLNPIYTFIPFVKYNFVLNTHPSGYAEQIKKTI